MNNTEKNLDLGLTNMKRNPYLVDYAEYKKARERRMPPSMAETAKPAPARRAKTEKERRRAALAQKRKKLFYKRLAITVAAVMTVVLIPVVAVRIWNSVAEAREAESGEIQEQQNPVLFNDLAGKKVQGLDAEVFGKHPTWTEDFLTPNEYSRPGDELKQVNSIFVHYTANPGTSAAQNRSYFEQLKDNHERSASAHFIIGYEGEILQCIPLDEIAYAVQTRNEDSISIECCYLEKDGSFTQETYDSLILLLRWLKDAYGLDSDDILRHYDCGGKKCPLYYTEHEDAWEQLKKDVK